MEFLIENNQVNVYKNGAVVVKYNCPEGVDINEYKVSIEDKFASVANRVEDISEAKQEKITELHNKYQAEYDAYLAQYPAREVATFATKQAEATAYTLDNTSPTPSIDSIVLGYGGSKDEYVQSVMNKVSYLAQQEGSMVAKRDAIKAATTVAELDAIII